MYFIISFATNTDRASRVATPSLVSAACCSAMDGSSTAAWAPWMWGLFEAQRFGGAKSLTCSRKYGLPNDLSKRSLKMPTSVWSREPFAASYKKENPGRVGGYRGRGTTTGVIAQHPGYELCGCRHRCPFEHGQSSKGWAI